MYNFAVEEELIEHNPLAALKFAFNEVSRDRVLSIEELAKIWRILELAKATTFGLNSGSHHFGVSPSMALAIQVCLYTCQRGSEVAGMKRGELDLDTLIWVLPASRTKSKRENIVPLSNQAAGVMRHAITLAETRNGRPLKADDAVFPSPRAKRKDIKGGLPEQIRPIERLSLNRAMARVTAEAGVNNATLHDLRRTGATLMCSERIGTLGEVVARILNHSATTPSVTSIYNRYGYISEKRSALNSWAELISSNTMHEVNEF